jgi:hypothetical protein
VGECQSHWNERCRYDSDAEPKFGMHGSLPFLGRYCVAVSSILPATSPEGRESTDKIAICTSPARRKCRRGRPCRKQLGAMGRRSYVSVSNSQTSMPLMG